jgi:hypothetical protein
MSTTVYLGQAAQDQVHAAQLTIDAHVPNAATNRCQPCGREWPCPPATHALTTLNRYQRLPRRRPGATRPELLDRQVTGRPMRGGTGLHRS